MVDKEVASVMLEEMRKTKGFEILLGQLKDRYLSYVRTLMRADAEGVAKCQISIQNITGFLEYTGMSKEDVNRWMEIH